VVAPLTQKLAPVLFQVPDQIDPIHAAVETPDLVRDRVLRAAQYLPVSQLGTTDDCGFAPFADDVSTSRDVAFAKICARVEGTAQAVEELSKPVRTKRGGSSL